MYSKPEIVLAEGFQGRKLIQTGGKRFQHCYFLITVVAKEGRIIKEIKMSITKLDKRKELIEEADIETALVSTRQQAEVRSRQTGIYSQDIQVCESSLTGKDYLYIIKDSSKSESYATLSDAYKAYFSL